MQYRKFGRTDLEISEIGFGAWAIGGEAIVGGMPIGWGPADDQVSLKAIQAAVDEGINFFDTADFYGLGHSEELLGKALAAFPDTIIATKVGQRNINNAIVIDYSKEYIIDACESSLRRLKREVIDYYQLHAARMKHLEQGECIEAMEKLKRDGKIRYWGLSLNTFQPEAEASYLMEHNLADGFQLVFNLINQRAKSILLKAGKKGYGIIARMPLQFGLLSGKFSPDSHFEKGDHRNFRLTPEIIRQTKEILDNRIWPLARTEKMNYVEFALNFILSFHEVSTVIPGIRTAKQVKQNAIDSRKLDSSHFDYLQTMAETDWAPVLKLMEIQG